MPTPVKKLSTAEAIALDNDETRRQNPLQTHGTVLGQDRSVCATMRTARKVSPHCRQSGIQLRTWSCWTDW